MTYFSLALALVVAAALLAFVHIRETQGNSVNNAALRAIAVVVKFLSVATTVQV